MKALLRLANHYVCIARAEAAALAPLIRFMLYPVPGSAALEAHRVLVPAHAALCVQLFLPKHLCRREEGGRVCMWCTCVARGGAPGQSVRHRPMHASPSTSSGSAGHQPSCETGLKAGNSPTSKCSRS